MFDNKVKVILPFYATITDNTNFVTNKVPGFVLSAWHDMLNTDNKRLLFDLFQLIYLTCVVTKKITNKWMIFVRMPSLSLLIPWLTGFVYIQRLLLYRIYHINSTKYKPGLFCTTRQIPFSIAMYLYYSMQQITP